MNELNQLLTTIEQQKKVYQALSHNPEAQERWEKLMREIGMNEKTLKFIKGEVE